MIREEKVKDLLTELIDMIDNGSQRDLDKADEIGTFIIKLFKQELCGDAISREDVLVALTEEWTEPTDELIHRFIRRIKNLPSVTPQPKIGHWISHREHCENLGVMPSGLGAYEWCSNCDCGIDVREWHMNNYNYCPNCGCRMIDPQESEGVE